MLEEWANLNVTQTRVTHEWGYCDTLGGCLCRLSKQLGIPFILTSRTRLFRVTCITRDSPLCVCCDFFWLVSYSRYSDPVHEEPPCKASDDPPSDPWEVTGGFQSWREGNWRPAEWLAEVRLISGSPGLAPNSDGRAASSVQGCMFSQDEFLYLSIFSPLSPLCAGVGKRDFCGNWISFVPFWIKISPG